MKFRITYSIITPESAEHSDYAEHGFVEPGYQMQVPIDEINDSDWPADKLAWTLAQAEQYLGRHGMEDSGSWFTTIDPERNYQTGAETIYSLHPADTITGASYERLRQIFEWSTDPRRKRD